MKQILFRDLPVDMQQVAADIVDRYDLDDRPLPVHQFSLRRFPVLPCERNPDAFIRSEFMPYVEPMRQGILPPVLVVGRVWIDGCHRVWAARRLKLPTIPVIDLADAGIPASAVSNYDRIATLTS
jgi:hypothetical protein